MLSISRKSVSRFLLLLISLLIIASLSSDLIKFGLGYDYMMGLGPLLRVGEEKNIPTWYAVCSLLSASALLLIIGRLETKKKSPQKMYWLMLSAIFLYLAYDEAFSIHEKLGSVGKRLVDNQGIFHFAWIVPASLIVIVVGLLFLRFLISLEPSIRNRFILGGGLYVFGAIGFEAISGHYLTIRSADLGYALIETTEESLEMFGIYVFILALLKYMAVNFNTITISFSQPSPHDGSLPEKALET